MGSLLSSNPKHVPSAPKKVAGGEISSMDRAILDLKNARDRLHRYRKKLEQEDAKLLLQAKKAKDAGRNEQALGLLRLRKFKQVQASDCEAQLLNVLQMVETIDSKKNETRVLQALAAGKDTLQKMHQETTVEDVLKLMDSIAEEIAVEQEINDILRERVPILSPDDEQAVEDELAALVQQAETRDDKIYDLPVPPTKIPQLPIATTTDTVETSVAAAPAKVPVLG